MYLIIAVLFATSFLASVAFLLIKAVPFATSLLAAFPFVYDNCCSFCYLMSRPLFHFDILMAVPSVNSLLAAVPFVLIKAVLLIPYCWQLFIVLPE